MEETLSKIPKQYRDDNIRKFQPDLEDQIPGQVPDTLYGAINENQTWTSLRPSYEPIDVDSGKLGAWCLPSNYLDIGFAQALSYIDRFDEKDADTRIVHPSSRKILWNVEELLRVCLVFFLNLSF